MNYPRLLKRLSLPLLLFLIVLRHFLEVRKAPNPYDPLLTNVVMIVASISLIFVVIQEYRDLKGKKDEGDREPKLIHLRHIFMFLLIVGYVIALPYAGFIVSTVLFLLASFFFLKIGGWKTYVFVPVGFTLVIYVVFVHLLSLKLPSGTLWNVM